MKNKDMDINLISELTGLSTEEIKKLWTSDKFTYQILYVNNFFINK